MISLTLSERGILSEWWVVRDRVSGYREKLVTHRRATPFAEIDLLFHCPENNHFTLIEVKTSSLLRPILKAQQARALLAAREYIEEAYGRSVQLTLAVVSYVDQDWRFPKVHYFDYPW